MAPLSSSAAIRFQSTLLMRGATSATQISLLALGFQSTLLMRGATWGSCRHRHRFVFQSTLLMRGATGDMGAEDWRAGCISIHAPHARSDVVFGVTSYNRRHFNPRSSCEERHLHSSHILFPGEYFNPRSSCEERPLALPVST